jgi:hypothetical protein
MGIFGKRGNVDHSVSLTKYDRPAFDREEVAVRGGVDFVKKFDKVGISLSKRGLTGIMAEVAVILDHSGSMSGNYQRGKVQELVDRALAFGLQVDYDGNVPVIPFDSKVHPTVEVGLHNFAGVVNREIYKPNDMGGTYLAPAFEFIDGYTEDAERPLFLIIITDDSPSDRAKVTEWILKSSRRPIFVKVLTLVDTPYWDNLDDNIPASERLLDNIDAKRITLQENDLEFADKMVDEWDKWIKLATDAGVLT